MPMEKNRLKTLNKLIDNGFDTEKKITGLDLQGMLAIPGITVPEIQIITQLQDAIKTRKVIEYLSNAKDVKDAKASDDFPFSGGVPALAESADAVSEEEETYGGYYN